MAAPTADLDAIKTKVRRLTRSPSLTQLTDNDLVNYINTFVVYDFPEHLRTFNLRQTFSFYTNPGQDVYPTNTIAYAGATTNPLYDFQNRYISVHNPVFIAGYQRFFTQSEAQFFGIYPKVVSIASTGFIGDGVTTTFTGTITTQQGINNTGPSGLTQNIALLQRNVLFNSVDASGIGLAMVDIPVVDTNTGYNFTQGNLYPINSVPSSPPTALLINNNIDYITGNFTVTFTGAPDANASINSQVVPLAATLPQALMFYGNQFTVRPIPDQVYTVTFEVYKVPYYLDNNIVSQDVPELNEYWQYIAYGAAKKIFEDRMDNDGVQAIMPEFKTQEALCLRRTLVQYSNERTATIYTEQTDIGSGTGGWGAWGGPY